MVINMKNEHALVALICVAVAAMTGSASAVTAEVAKRCNALTAKAYPPRQAGNPAAGSAKGTAQSRGPISANAWRTGETWMITPARKRSEQNIGPMRVGARFQGGMKKYHFHRELEAGAGRLGCHDEIDFQSRLLGVRGRCRRSSCLPAAAKAQELKFPQIITIR